MEMSSEARASKEDGTASGPSITTSNMTPLPDHFEPGPDDVICGRGKKCYNHVGNERFRLRVLTFLDEYSRAKSKLDKSGVLSKVVEEVRHTSPHGGFVKQDTNGIWFEVGDFLAREKTSQAFRDALHDRYKSSNLSKKKRRQQEHAKSHQQAYSKFVRSEYDVSSRFERLSNEGIKHREFALPKLVKAWIATLWTDNICTYYTYYNPLYLADGLEALETFNRNNYESLSRHIHGMQSPRQQMNTGFASHMERSGGVIGFHRVPDNPRSISNFPDPLFGSSMNAANAMPSEMGRERLPPPANIYARQSRTTQSLPVTASEPLPVIPKEIKAFHHSLPEIDFFALEDKDHTESTSFHMSLPEISLSTHMPLEYDEKMPATSDVEPVPYNFINVSERIQPTQRIASQLSSGPFKKCDPIPSNSTRSSTDRLSKDLLECLDKMTYHSIADDNPFEPIPLTPQQEKANRTKQGLTDAVRAELLNNPMDDSERCDEFAEG